MVGSSPGNAAAVIDSLNHVVQVGHPCQYKASNGSSISLRK